MRAKKSLGQNFLTSEKIVHEIIDAADIAGDDVVLEVGPGKGVLTEGLITEADKVIAIEKDHRLIEPLNQKFSQEISNNKLRLVEGDILEISPSTLLGTTNYKLVANIPYYITGQILRKFLTTEKKPERMVLMVQKEVAERIVARDHKESLLSLSVKAYGMPKIIRTVPRTFFSPTPKVDSAILLIENISDNYFKNLGPNTEEKFFKLIHAGFGSKRKKLINNLSGRTARGGTTALKNAGFGSKIELEGTFTECGIPLNTRAEDLDLGQWKNLLKELR